MNELELGVIIYVLATGALLVFSLMKLHSTYVPIQYYTETNLSYRNVDKN